MNKNEAIVILEDVLDTLVEVGNGVTDKMLHEACDKLFNFRDNYFKQLQEFKDEYDNALKFIADDKVHETEVHCTCVPLLRTELKKYNKVKEYVNEQLPIIEHYYNKINAYEAGTALEILQKIKEIIG